MKKTLIAMAAVAVAGTASAQVSISGQITFDALSNTKVTSTSAADATTSDTTDNTAGLNGLTTSQISMTGSEDLGGGMSIGFVINSGIADGAVGDRDRNVSLSGDFGTVRLGTFIPAAAMGYYGFSGASTTATGATYDIGFGTALVNGATAPSGGSFERNDNQIQYTTSISGITVNANYGHSTTDASEMLGTAETAQSGVSASYTAGALTLAIGQNSRTVDAEGASGVATGAQIEADLDWYGASYDFGVAKASFTNVQRKDQTAAAATGTIAVDNNIDVNAFGVSVPMGALTLTASMFRGTNDVSSLGTDNVDLTGNQVFASYALSKRTSVFATHGNTNAARASGNTAGVATKVTRSSVGMLHSF